jgi:hypothetical protein
LFSYIYKLGRWFDGESRSGAGSSLAYTQNLRERLPALLHELGVRTLLDVPCGDFHWMSHVPLMLDKYVGADIVPAMIRDNQRRHPRADRNFVVLDIVRTIPPKVDLIFCRDCLFHFPFALAFKALQNFRSSGSRYLLTTTFFDGENENVASGYYYRINLETPPFNFPPPIRSIQDSPDQPTRQMALWELASLPVSLDRDL